MGVFCFGRQRLFEWLATMRPTPSPACLRSATRHTQHTSRLGNEYRLADVRGIGLYTTNSGPAPASLLWRMACAREA